jgi:hypothetical protein
MIPQHLRPLFWDINLDSFDPSSYPQYTIARVLEFGDREAVAWLREVFSERQIKEVVCKERRLTRRSATFWALVYDIPQDQVAALCTPTESDLWPH